jgi:hypothetical protein
MVNTLIDAGAAAWRHIRHEFFLSNPMLYFNVFHISWERSPASKQLSREGQ